MEPIKFKEGNAVVVNVKDHPLNERTGIVEGFQQPDGVIVKLKIPYEGYDKALIYKDNLDFIH